MSIDDRLGYQLCTACDGKSGDRDCPLCYGRGLMEMGKKEPGSPEETLQLLEGISVTISIEAEADLDGLECFPDAVADGLDPSTLTAEDVLLAIQESGSKRSALADWGIDDYIVTVSMNNNGKRTMADW